MLDAIRTLDAFPKTLDDFRIKTASGAFGTYNIYMLFASIIKTLTTFLSLRIEI
jgi:hypothetical protein